MDQLLERTGVLKRMLVEFARSDRFDLELSALIWQEFPDGQVAAESEINTIVDDFLLKHRLAGGTTVVEEFVLAHPELPDEERDLLLSWLNAVDGIFEVRRKERDAVLLFNAIDELTYRTRSNLGGRMLRPLRKGMFVVGRVVPLGDDWLMSGYLSVLPASERDQLLAIAAVRALQHPEQVFRNPAKLAQARSALAQQRKIFVELFGADLIVARGDEVPGKLEAFWHKLAEERGSDAPPGSLAEDSADLLATESVALHFVQGVGLRFYPDYHLLEELFTDPALITSPDHREALWAILRAPDVSPEPLRQLAARDPAKASQVFTDLLWRNREFSWSADGEALLRRTKPGYFDGTVLPQNVPLSRALSDAYDRAIQG